MLKITCYGAVHEIGGNKVLLQDGGSSIMLDFGKGFLGTGMYFDEFLQPRTNSALRDLLTLSILPPIQGIYRHDLLRHGGIWEELKTQKNLPESARRLFENDLLSYDEYTEKYGLALDGILLSHGHTDHCQHLCFVDPRIPVYCTRTTYAILRAAEEVGRGTFESDICSARTRSWTTMGATSTFPGALKIEADSEGQKRDIVTVDPYKPFHAGAFEVRAIPVDHSVPGACAFLIECPSGVSLFYTGDVRFHGRFSQGTTNITSELRDLTNGLRPDILISEGTRITSTTKDNEQDVENQIREAVAGCAGLAIVDFGWKDTTRFQTIRNAARATGRKLAVSPKVAYLWALLREEDPEGYPDLALDDTVTIYTKRTDSMTYSLADYSLNKYLAGTCADWGVRSQDMKKAWAAGDEEYLLPRLCNYLGGLRTYDIAEKPSEYIVHAGYFDMNELFDLMPPPGSIFVKASTEPFNEEMALGEEKLSNWLSYFGINNGEGIKHSHVSGHASGDDLLQFIDDMEPKRIVPIHTEHPDAFDKALGDKCEVILPQLSSEICITDA